ncbi:MAG: shikimate kinase AroK [Thalassolituus sp.]|uniref:Shikimate kinase n=1 Tax=Thalassolituus maritimus TaxID=484498 RepID=A0ABQ0A371_9GAMM|nr:shikimate kinase AroK [Pseudomonadota bacterium]MEC8103957.1 shikimate kinase AroK [Pseudomonadota bacterium]MEC8523429.1 shikimate kinase AroK [Pseudomonadota bacterium]TNC86044.1 MAG: shikimate kinase AroK [Thalassolituus sp.]
MTQSVFLIGPMGAGKSTIGRLLSQELKFEFYDSDKVIEDRCGADIPWIFDKEGEAGFREREESVIDELTQQKGIVLSTGGGAVLRAENRQHLASRGTVIYLCTSVEQQLARTARDRNRPLLQTANPEAVLRKLFEERDPLYRSVADIIIETDQRNPRWVIQDLKKRLEGE